MGDMTIRNMDEQSEARLRRRAHEHGRSIEEEAAEILRDALAEVSFEGGSILSRIRRRVATTGGVELDLPPREPMRDPSDLTT